MKLTQKLTFLALLSSTFAFSQVKLGVKPQIFSFNISLSDYSFPGQIKDSSLSVALKQKEWYKPGEKSFGLGISFWKGLTQKVDFSANLTGTFSNFPALFVKNDSIGKAKFTPQLDALLHLKAFSEKSKVNPFLTAGVGAGYFIDQIEVYAPLGAGLQFRFKEGAYLIAQAQWRKKITSGINNDYLFYSVGFAQQSPFASKKVEVKEPEKPVMPPDADADGFEDTKDECPTVAGKIMGCPDSDGDGIADKNDKCPTEKGTLNGCPDTDNDGIADKDDKCKDEAGVARYQGCPIPDSDKDGINDEEDKCPDIAGVTANNGCPEVKVEEKEKVERAAKNIYFNFASDVILKKSFTSLDEVLKLLQNNPNLNLSISAHADSRGTTERNMMWSERRAKAVADYFINNGIAEKRLTYKGYGDTLPVADNKTEKGRSLNRRVEMTLSY